jgi:streptogramin lyase
MPFRISHCKLLLCLAAALGLGLAVAPAGALAAPTINEYATGTGPTDVTLGPDGNIWFVEAGQNRIGRVTPGGGYTFFSAGLSLGAGLAGITAGPDGNLWFTESNADRIGKITPTGAITEYGLGIDPGSQPQGITAGPDGNLWFTETGDDEIGRITTAGLIQEYPIAGPGTNFWGIVAGSDGNLWFTERNAAGGIGRASTSGVSNGFWATSSLPAGIALGPDGALWFAGSANPGSIGRITTAGTITQYTAGLTTTGVPLDIVTGNDGNMYFTENAGSGKLGQITPSGVITEFTASLTSAPFDITSGADGNIWFTESSGNRVARLTLPPAATTGVATAISATGATLAGTATPRAQATTVQFDWGLTSAYGTTTTPTAAGSGTSAVPVTQVISGLVPGTTYYYRVVATNASGTTYGADLSFTTTAPAPFAVPVAIVPPPTPGLPPATRPVLGRSATIAAISGTVLVELPGTDTYLPLSAASTVPVGTTIDATRGTLRLTNVRDRSGKLQTGRFWGGLFTVRQTRGKKPSTVLTLTAPLACSKSRHPSSVAAAKRVRELWGSDKNGRFVTRGRSAVATVRGTAWFTRDTCAGTLVKVTSGTVAVRDLVLKRTVIVRAGQSYLARLR